MLRFLSFLAVILSVAGPVAAQPFSQSMAQCAGLFEGVRNVISKPENLAKLDAAARAFSQAAVVEARAENREDPAAWVAQHQSEMRAEWEAYGGLAAFSQDFIDWTGYCRAFADDRGIDMDFD
jgi:hypothetical protein